MVKSKVIEHVLNIVKEKGVLRPRELDAYGIPREYLRRLHDRGQIVRVGRGLYVLPDAEVTEHHTLTQAAKRVPHGIICLLSALQFHGLTTQMPFEVWMAIEPKAKQPKVDKPVMRFLRFSGPSYKEGIEQHTIEGVQIKVYNPPKSVADCFKFRNKIGLDVALESLRDCLRQRKCTADSLWKYARICRVANIMKPYIEAML